MNENAPPPALLNHTVVSNPRSHPYTRVVHAGRGYTEDVTLNPKKQPSATQKGPPRAQNNRPVIRGALQNVQAILVGTRELEGVAERLLEDGANVNVDGLVGASQGGLEVGDFLAVVLDVDAQQLEGNNAVLAVGLLGDDVEDCELVQLGGDLNRVEAGAEDEVVDGEVAKILLIGEVGEGGIALHGPSATS